MPFCPKQHGTLNFKIGNVSYKVEGDVSIQPLDVTVSALTHGHTYAEEVSPSIEATFRVPDALNVTDILSGCGKTVVVQERNGRTWKLTNASATFDGSPYNMTQGSVAITFVGEKMREINPNVQDLAAA